MNPSGRSSFSFVNFYLFTENDLKNSRYGVYLNLLNAFYPLLNKGGGRVRKGKKDKKNKAKDENLTFEKNKAFENKEIAGVDVDADYYDDFEPGEAVDYRAFCEISTTAQGAESEDLKEAADGAAVEPLAVETPLVFEEVAADETRGEASDEEDALSSDEPFLSDSAPLEQDDESDEPSRAKPVPDSLAAASSKQLSDLDGFFQVAFMQFYNFFYRLGIQNFRYGKRIFIRLGRLLMRPVRYTIVLARVFVLGVDRLLLKSVHTLNEEFTYFRKEIKSSANYLRRASKESPLSGFAIIAHYTKKGFKKYKEMFRTAVNFSLPVVALLVLWTTATHWNTVTYALQLTYNGDKTWNVLDESVYLQAQDLVNEQLGLGVYVQAGAAENIEEDKEKNLEKEEKEEKKELVEKDTLVKPTYELARVQLNELSDETTLSDNLIENSVEKLTPACGIFIDGEFIGAVKNESDATGVFENLLAPYKTDDASTNAAFVEDVQFTQGLYSGKAEMMDAKELQEKLSTTKAEAVIHTVQNGETIWSIATANGLTESALLQRNPDKGQLIKTGDTLKVSSQVNFIRVKLIKTEVRSVEVPFETVKTDNPNLFKGDTRIIRKGVLGQEKVTELVTYIDDVRVSAQEIDRIRLSDPIPQKTDVGTKSTKVSGSSGSYTVKVSNEGFVWPVPGYYSISSPFGYRSRGFHSGIDISGSGINGKVIVAAKDGVVESTTISNGGLGNHVVINHGGGIKTRYGHCLSGSISVSAGQRVSAGQAIARVGSTGNSTGPHLHFEVVINGSAVNPVPYVR